MADLSKEILDKQTERRAATIGAVKTRSTLISRWASAEMEATNELWLERAKMAASLIPAGCHVIDVGCGAMKLEGLLAEGTRYTPMDVVSRDSRTIVCDLNKDRVPPVDADFLAMLGVLEYLHDVPGVLRQFAHQISRGLISYHPYERGIGRDRLSVGWVNSMNSKELLSVIRESGFRYIRVVRYKPSLHFYLISKAKDLLTAGGEA